MLTEKDYCDYETSRELKELGFVAGLGEDDYGHCLYDDAWHDQVDRPLLYEAQKWLREEKDIHLAVYYGKGRETNRVWVCNLVMENKVRQLTYEGVLVKTFSSYEEALSEGIKEAVKILKGE